MPNNFWWIEALVGFVLFLLLQYVVLKFLSRSKTKLFKPPLALLIWSLGLLYFVDVMGKHLGFAIAVGHLDTLKKTAIVASFTWLFFRWKKEFELTLLTHPKRQIDKEMIQAVGRLATIGVMILTGLILLQIFGVNTAPLLAFGSIGAASLGFAGKDVMANFCSGIMLQMTRSLVLGDQIYLPEKKLQGHIEEIGWFRTLIRDTEKRAVYLPNNFFSTMLVVNISRMTHRHILQTVRLPFNAVEKIPEITSKIHEVIVHFPGIDMKCPLHVFLKSFENYACEIEIEAYSTITDGQAFNRSLQDLLFKIQVVLKQMEVPLAIPTMVNLTAPIS
jgi:MscS family membrane protein